MPTRALVRGSHLSGQPGAKTVPSLAIPGYEILGELGRGGMAVVHKAVQTRLKRVVALKMILAGAHAGPEQQARFRLEVEAVARLAHPHIVQIYEVGEHAGQPFCALEFMDGSSLDKKLAGEPQPAPLAARLTETLARAMEAAHRRGIVHRDLKPANVLLAGGPATPLEQCTPKISDFGLAKQVDDDSWKTRSGAILGTPSYMAPEQAEGRLKDMGPPVDVYALGAILYELLTGRPPFRAATLMDTLDQVRHQEPVPPSRLEPRVPRDLETVCLKCLQKEPYKRYPSAQELAEDLKRFLAGEPVHARPTGHLERAVKWARRRPALAALVVVSVLAAIGVVGGFLYAAESRRQLAEQRLEQQQRLDVTREEVRGLINQGRTHVGNLRATEEKARAALAAVGVAEDQIGPPTPDGGFTAAQKLEVRENCYLLVLILADALAQPRPGQKEDDRRRSAETALRLLEGVERLDIPTKAYHSRRARYLRQAGRREDAAAEDRQAAALQPTRALDHYLVGDDRYEEGDLEAASRHFESVLALDPEHFWARYFLSVSYLRQGRPAEARTGLTACLSQRRDLVWLYLMRGFANGQLGEVQPAEDDFANALALLRERPDDGALHGRGQEHVAGRGGNPGGRRGGCADRRWRKRSFRPAGPAHDWRELPGRSAGFPPFSRAGGCGSRARQRPAREDTGPKPTAHAGRWATGRTLERSSPGHHLRRRRPAGLLRAPDVAGQAASAKAARLNRARSLSEGMALALLLPRWFDLHVAEISTLSGFQGERAEQVLPERRQAEPRLVALAGD
jgi:tetratricopeptide (TPR) repeat protein